MTRVPLFQETTIYIYIYTYIHTYIHTCIYIYMCIYIYIYVYIYIWSMVIYVILLLMHWWYLVYLLCVFIYIYIYISICLRIYLFIHLFMLFLLKHFVYWSICCLFVCEFGCLWIIYVCVYVCVCHQYMFRIGSIVSSLLDVFAAIKFVQICSWWCSVRSNMLMETTRKILFVFWDLDVGRRHPTRFPIIFQASSEGLAKGTATRALCWLQRLGWGASVDLEMFMVNLEDGVTTWRMSRSFNDHLIIYIFHPFLQIFHDISPFLDDIGIAMEIVP